MARRAAPKVEEKSNGSPAASDMEIVRSMLSDIQIILGIQDVNQPAVYSILIKSDNDSNKVLTKIKRNLCYYRRVLSTN